MSESSSASFRWSSGAAREGASGWVSRSAETSSRHMVAVCGARIGRMVVVSSRSRFLSRLLSRTHLASLLPPAATFWRRVPSFLLVAPFALQAACSLSLFQGDRALAESRYSDAAAAYKRTWGPEEDAALFRLALIQSLPDSPLFDPSGASTTFEELQRRHPKSAYGFAGKVMVARLQRQLEMETRLSALDGTLAETKKALSDAAAEQDHERQTRQAQIDQLQQERDRLSADLKALRDEHAELVLLRQEHLDIERLRRENTQLKEELEELKRIDLRR